MELFLIALFLLNLFPLELVVGFQKTVYSVSEGDGIATVIVEIKQGTVGNGQTVSLEFTTGDNTAISEYIYLNMFKNFYNLKTM